MLTNRSSNSIDELPDLVLGELFKYIDVSSKICLSALSKSWRRACLPHCWKVINSDFSFLNNKEQMLYFLGRYGVYIQRVSVLMESKYQSLFFNYCPNLMQGIFLIDSSVAFDRLIFESASDRNSLSKINIMLDMPLSEFRFISITSLSRLTSMKLNLTYMFKHHPTGYEAIVITHLCKLSGESLKNLEFEVSEFPSDSFSQIALNFPNLLSLSIIGNKLSYTNNQGAPIFRRLEVISLRLKKLPINFDFGQVLGDYSRLKLKSISIYVEFISDLNLHQYLFSTSWPRLRSLETTIVSEIPSRSMINFPSLTNINLTFRRYLSVECIPLLLSSLTMLRDVSFSGLILDESFKLTMIHQSLEKVSLQGITNADSHFVNWLTNNVPNLIDLSITAPFSVSSRFFDLLPENYRFQRLSRVNVPRSYQYFNEWVHMGVRKN